MTMILVFLGRKYWCRRIERVFKWGANVLFAISWGIARCRRIPLLTNDRFIPIFVKVHCLYPARLSLIFGLDSAFDKMPSIVVKTFNTVGGGPCEKYDLAVFHLKREFHFIILRPNGYSGGYILAEYNTIHNFMNLFVSQLLIKM